MRGGGGGGGGALREEETERQREKMGGVGSRLKTFFPKACSDWHAGILSSVP